MKKIELGQTLTLFANVGVIAGLVLVALELRQTTNAVLAATYQARSESSSEWDQRLADSEFRAPVAAKYLREGRDALNDEEVIRMNALMVAGFTRKEAEYYQYELGLLDDVWYSRTFDYHMQIWVPRWRDWGLLEAGGQIRESARPSFLAEVEKYIDSPNLDVELELEVGR